MNTKTFGYRLLYVIYHIACRFILIAIGPLVVIIVLNILILRTVRRASKQRRAMSSQRRTTAAAENQHDEMTRMVVAVVVVFIACQLTYLCWRSVDTGSRFGWYKVNREVHYKSLPITDALLVLNSAVNFVLYCLVGKKFRQMLRDLFRGCCRSYTFEVTPSSKNSDTRSTEV